MFAGHFVTSGLRAVREPEDLTARAEDFTQKAVPLVQRLVPASYSSHIPQETKTWVRIAGFLKIVGGSMFATGIGRRLGACFLVPATLLDVAMVWPDKHAGPAEKAERRAEALQHVALLGAAVLATQDLQGQPSLGWRAEQRRQQASAQVSEKAKAASAMTRKSMRKQARKAKKLAKRVTR